MYSISLRKLVHRYPEEAETVKRLAALLDAPQNAKNVYTLDRLSNLLKPQSREGLALILAELVKAGILKLIVRVESPSSKGGIKDFDTIEEVPETIYDWRAQQDLQVGAENLRVLYASQKENA